MKNNSEAKLLRIFIGESDKIGNIPLYEAIVFKAKEEGLSGATVTKGIMGFGANSKINSAKLFTISQDFPLIVEVIDVENNSTGQLASILRSNGFNITRKILKYDARPFTTDELIKKIWQEIK
ncbi:DUF190 domain-containing protein [candidate division TA06 bacterium]|uniref:DUF190 domain-containing protein n=1 Tax=candidate division TA06 bacterium TaxID=2250710 RepID=A0A660SES1_UNCT6|nr:MAG: DUF190 domain-containing protein [candidate division TA06 bacterium]